MIACFFTSMVQPLLFSLMLWLDLKVDSTRAGSQIRSIASGLAIQEYNLLEVKFDLGALSLFEEFGNSRFKFDCRLFHLHLREQESIVKLKVLLLFF
jgi:cell division FtsZ-interacting protein ZapD